MEEKNSITLMVALKIYEYYPNRLCLMSVLDEETNKYTCSVWSMNDFNFPVRTLFCDEDYSMATEKEAVDRTTKQIDEAMARVKIMSN